MQHILKAESVSAVSMSLQIVARFFLPDARFCKVL